MPTPFVLEDAVAIRDTGADDVRSGCLRGGHLALNVKQRPPGTLLERLALERLLPLPLVLVLVLPVPVLLVLLVVLLVVLLLLLLLLLSMLLLLLFLPLLQLAAPPPQHAHCVLLFLVLGRRVPIIFGVCPPRMPTCELRVHYHVRG